MSKSKSAGAPAGQGNGGGRFANLMRPMYPSKPKTMSASRRRKLLFSYAPDWAITLILAAAFYALDKVNGYRRQFSLNDTSLRYPHAEHERVPDAPLYFIVFGIPIILQPIINFLTVRSWWDLHNSSLGLVLGLALTGATTQFIKITVGRPRPDIISRCDPPPGLVDPPFGLTDWTVCRTVDDALLRDGFRSFPSGHSSMSFAGLGFLAFYLAGKLHLFDTRGHAGKAWISIFPFFGAAMVAISRTMDYRHHWHDVLVGSALGIIMSFFAYRQYYPPLSSEVAHRPYSPRIKDDELSEDGESPILPTHMQGHGHGQTTSYNPTSYNPNSLNVGAYQTGGRYNHTPSPPPPNPFEDGHSHAHGVGYVPAYAHGTAQGQSGYEHVTLGVDGTVPRPNPGSLEEVWKEGAEGYDGTVPRPRSREGSGGDDLSRSQSHSRALSGERSASSIPPSGSGMTTRELQQQHLQQQQQQQQQQKGAVMTSVTSPLPPMSPGVVVGQENAYSIPLKTTNVGSGQESGRERESAQYRSAYDGIQ